MDPCYMSCMRACLAPTFPSCTSVLIISPGANGTDVPVGKLSGGVPTASTPSSCIIAFSARSASPAPPPSGVPPPTPPALPANPISKSSAQTFMEACLEVLWTTAAAGCGTSSGHGPTPGRGALSPSASSVHTRPELGLEGGLVAAAACSTVGCQQKTVERTNGWRRPPHCLLGGASVALAATEAGKSRTAWLGSWPSLATTFSNDSASCTADRQSAIVGVKDVPWAGNGCRCSCSRGALRDRSTQKIAARSATSAAMGRRGHLAGIDIGAGGSRAGRGITALGARNGLALSRATALARPRARWWHSAAAAADRAPPARGNQGGEIGGEGLWLGQRDRPGRHQGGLRPCARPDVNAQQHGDLL
eukprot:359469-Chlamydomonas_euryale.AAC.20